MIRLKDSTILLYRLVYLNSFISISTESTVSEELAVTAAANVKISKRKNTE